MSNLHELLLTTSKIDAKNTIGKNTFQYLTTTAAAETVFSAALCKKRVVTAQGRKNNKTKEQKQQWKKSLNFCLSFFTSLSPLPYLCIIIAYPHFSTLLWVPTWARVSLDEVKVSGYEVLYLPIQPPGSVQQGLAKLPFLYITLKDLGVKS